MKIENDIISIINSYDVKNNNVYTDLGNNCSIITCVDKYMAITTGQIVSNTHYFVNKTDPKLAGKKLLKKCISNFAAIGGAKPEYAFVSVTISKNICKSMFDNFYNGLAEEAKKWNIKICGGDTVINKYVNKKTPIVSSMTLLGFIEKDNICLKSNAKSKDLLYTTGYIGNSLESGHHINFTPRLNESTFLSKGFTNTMSDTTDGLLITVSDIEVHSNVAIDLDYKKIPLREGCVTVESAVEDGEDYELIFTISEENEDKLLNSWPFNVKLTKIGRVI